MTPANRPGTPLPALSGPAEPSTPEDRFGRHVQSGLRGLVWHHVLGRLGLDCCPLRVRGRTRRVEALAAAHPACSKSLLYKAMKFASQHSPVEARRWQADGLAWDHLAVLLPLPPAERRRAVAEVVRRGLTSRAVRLWRQETYGIRPPRGGRSPVPLPDHLPVVRARTLTTDCRSLCARHRDTAGVFEGLLLAIAAGNPPGPEELTWYRAAVNAAREVGRKGEELAALLDRCVESCGAGAA